MELKHNFYENRGCNTLYIMIMGSISSVFVCNTKENYISQRKWKILNKSIRWSVFHYLKT